MRIDCEIGGLSNILGGFMCGVCLVMMLFLRRMVFFLNGKGFVGNCEMGFLLRFEKYSGFVLFFVL